MGLGKRIKQWWNFIHLAEFESFFGIKPNPESNFTTSLVNEKLEILAEYIDFFHQTNEHKVAKEMESDFRMYSRAAKKLGYPVQTDWRKYVSDPWDAQMKVTN